jgi:hypothetical protein
MQNKGEIETEIEPELPPLVCVKCAAEYDHEPWPKACPRCQHPIDLEAQFAYCRGHNAFTVGQEILMKTAQGRRKKRLTSQAEKEGIECYLQAYSSLQYAFRGELAESQRQLGIRMMAAVASYFQHNSMISPLEAFYWSTLLVELNSHLEVLSLQDKLARNAQRGLYFFPLRWRWQTRLRQLEKAMRMIQDKLRLYEQRIGFTEPLHTRLKGDS